LNLFLVNSVLLGIYLELLQVGSNLLYPLRSKTARDKPISQDISSFSFALTSSANGCRVLVATHSVGAQFASPVNTFDIAEIAFAKCKHWLDPIGLRDN
jgi:hypothetical protein